MLSPIANSAFGAITPVQRMFSFLIATIKKLVWHPDCGPDLAEFTRDLAPGRAASSLM
jgi:hypothetical protein